MNEKLIWRGGGQAFLSDVNADLINAYRVVQGDVEALIQKLQIHAEKHGKDYYYEIRKQHHLSEQLERAARFIYLNKTCYNGLWRVNSRGEFNVPIGSSVKPAICQPDILRACHRALQGVDLHSTSFTEVAAGEGDFVYFDPPYHPVSQTSSFTSYAIGGFAEAEQEALRDLCLVLHERGTRIMLSNSDTEFIRKLYPSSIFTFKDVKAPRMVNCKSDKRGAVNEVLITNYDCDTSVV